MTKELRINVLLRCAQRYVSGSIPMRALLGRYFTSALFIVSMGCSMKQDLDMAQRAADEFHQSWKSHPDAENFPFRTAPLFYPVSGPNWSVRRTSHKFAPPWSAPVSSSTVGVHVDKMPAGTFFVRAV